MKGFRNAKACKPYWTNLCLELSSGLWCPTKTDSHGLDLTCSNTWSNKTVEKSWFSANLKKKAQNPNLSKTSSPSQHISVPVSTDSERTVTKTRRVKLKATPEQKALFRHWMRGYRWTYNKTIEYITSLSGNTPHWMKVKAEIYPLTKAHFDKVPGLVRYDAVKAACTAFKANKVRAKKLKRPFKMRFKSRKEVYQSCYIPKTALVYRSKDKEKNGKPTGGIYKRYSGKVKFYEALPSSPKDSKLVMNSITGDFWICVPYETTAICAENQGRIVSLDPGVRTFQTFFSEDSYGEIGKGDIGRIYRLCHYMDKLQSKISKSKGQPKRNMRKALARMRSKVKNLISEIHWKTYRFLVDNYDIILLPKFDTQNMVNRAKRKIRSKTARALMTWSHYMFRQRLEFKAFENGKKVKIVDEAYTSKTCSWSGEIVNNLGGKKIIRGSDGVSMSRDVNGARGIYLRALADSPELRSAKVSN